MGGEPAFFSETQFLKLLLEAGLGYLALGMRFWKF
jgi:hypothetical protein